MPYLRIEDGAIDNGGIRGSATCVRSASGTVEIDAENLLQAHGLPFGDPDLSEALGTIETWSRICRRETERLMPDFVSNPGYYDHSEPVFRMMVIVTVIQRDLGVRYNPNAIGNFSFADSRDCFLHGVLDERRLGTCVNIPVLYAAIGRKLRYPIYLALAKGHLFCQWEDEKSGRINMEATGIGLTCHTDEHYRTWPRPITEEEVARGDYLRPLTRQEELALFIGFRGHCLEDNGCMRESIACYRRAAELMPQPTYFELHLARAEQRLASNSMTITGAAV